MILSFTDALSQKPLFSLQADGIAAPIPGDIVLSPDNEQFTVLQRAFICHKKSVITKQVVIPMNQPKGFMIDVELRCAVAPNGFADEYMKKLEEMANAGT